MIKELIQLKRDGDWAASIAAGVALYLLNWLLALDFLLATLIGADPRLSVSALLGIRLHKNPQHLLLGKLPDTIKSHLLESASWGNYEYPPVNRSIWT